ncbi:unnamed protein product, partial [Amoebophrya sp. A25]
GLAQFTAGLSGGVEVGDVPASSSWRPQPGSISPRRQPMRSRFEEVPMLQSPLCEQKGVTISCKTRAELEEDRMVGG